MKKFAIVSLALAVAFAIVPAAFADPVTWTDWTSGTSGSPGSASGNMGGITVTYSGQTNGLGIQWASTIGSLYPGEGSSNWSPAGSYTGGVVGNAPPTSYNLVAIEGGSSLSESITFSSTVVNPIIAIWSLGANGIPASFDFNNPFTVVACGPSAEYNGGCITESGNNVFGVEGNGVIQFTGAFTSIDLTTPSSEDWYGFTVGETPEPSSLLLLGTGLLGFGLLLRRQLAH